VGIVGAGGNFGAVAAGFLFKSSEISWPTALMILGGIVMLISFVALTIQLGQEKTVHKKMIPVRILKDW
jgi:NNP family nitrate/nitrite transporter-like MFS transporter